MPAVSKSQQQAAGIALSAKRGETPVSDLKGAAKEMYDSMTEKELKDFAETKHTNLPNKKEAIMLSKLFHEVRETVKEELTEANSPTVQLSKKEIEKLNKDGKVQKTVFGSQMRSTPSNIVKRLQKGTKVQYTDYLDGKKKKTAKIIDSEVDFGGILQLKLQKESVVNEARIPRPIHDLINHMVNSKVHKKTVKISDEKKHQRFMKDVEPAVKAKLLRIDHDGDEMSITLGPEAQKMIEGLDENKLDEKMSTFRELNGKTVSSSIITKSGMVVIYFRDNTKLEFSNDGVASILESANDINEANPYKDKDLNFLIDQLSNSMEYYDKKEFVTHMSKETRYDKRTLASIFDKYWKLNPHQRMKFSTKDWNTWLMRNKFDINESVLNEAEEVEYSSLDSNEQKIIQTLGKVLDVDKTPLGIFKGIHGTVVEFEINKGVGGYRYDTKELKTLSRLPIRWIEDDRGSISVGL